MSDALEILNEETENEITSIVDGENEKTEESESQVGSKQVSEKDRQGARTVWTALHQEWAPELTKRDIIFRSKLNANEVGRLLPRYFTITRKKGGTNYYKWNQIYEVPTIDEPDWPLFEEDPKDSERENQTYQPHLTNFVIEDPNSSSEEKN